MPRALRQIAPTTADLDNLGRTPTSIALTYLAFGITWIVIGDTALLWYGKETGSAFWVELAKGSTYVILSSLLIYALVFRAVAKLKNLSALLSAAVSKSPDAIFFKDPEGRYLLLNDAACRSLGRSLNEVIGKTDAALFDEESARRIREVDALTMQGDRPPVQEEEQVSLGGINRSYWSTKAPVRDASGTIVGLIGIAHDVTERRNAERALRDSEERLRLALMASSMGVWDWEMASNRVVWSDECLAIFGCEHKAETLEDFAHYLHPDDRSRVLTCVSEAIANHTSYANEFRIVRPDGTIRWVTNVGLAHYDANGDPIRMIGTVQDVTERVEATTRLVNQREQLRLFLEHVNLPTAMFDTEMRYLYASKRWLTDLGIEGRELTGLCHYDVFPEVPLRWREIHQRCLAGAVETCDADRFDRADGVVQWFRWETRPWFAADGSPGGITIFAEDITQRVAAARNLAHQKTVLELVATGGELGSTLTEIVTLVEALIPGSICTIHTVDRETGELIFDVGPSIPQAYATAVSRIPIAEGSGSCGTAAARLEAVYVADIGADPLWERYRDTALSNGLAACWSVPIVVGHQQLPNTRAGQLLGTFAVYFRELRTPEPRDLEALAQATYLAGIAIGKHRAERSLAESEERFRLIAETVDEVFWMSSPDLDRIHYVSPAYKQIWGRSPETLYEDPSALIATLHPDDRPKMLESLPGRRAGRYSIQYRIIRPDGEIRWIEARGFPVLNAAEEIEYLVGSARDISLEKANERALQEREALARSILNSLNAEIAVLDHTGKITAVNDQWRRFAVENSASGDEREYAGIGLNYLEVCDRSESSYIPSGVAIATGIRRILSGEEKSYTVEYPCHSPNNERWFMLHVSALEGGNGVVVAHTDISDRKRTERALEQKHAILENILTYSPDYIYMKDAQGRYLAINPAGARAVGRTVEEILGHDDVELFGEEVAHQTVESDQRIFKEGNFENFEQQYLAPDGMRYVSTSKGPCRDADGNLIGLVGISRDITEQREKESARRRTDERYRVLVNSLPNAVFICTNGTISFCNRSFTEIMGVEERDSLGRSPLDFIETQHHHLAEGLMRQSRERSRPATPVELNLRTRDGRLVPVYMMAAGLDLEDGESVLFVATDLSEEVRTATLLNTIMGSVTDVIITIDRAGIIQSVNAASVPVLGWHESELIGTNVSRLMPEEHRRSHDSYLDSYLRTGTRKIIGSVRRLDALHKDGRLIPMEFTVTEFTLDGTPHFTGVLRDVSARILLEEQFRQSQKMEAVGRLAGGIAHDFNNLLTVINGYADLMMMKPAEATPGREQLTLIRSAGRQAAALTAQLLAFSRRSIVEPKVIDISVLLLDAKKLLQRLIGEDIAITVHSPSVLGRILADPAQIEQVILNLAVNSRDAMQGGGTLTFEARDVALSDPLLTDTGTLAPGKYVELQVADSGCGMTDEVKSQIFEPFFTTKAVGQGTGLGLSVVFGIVEQCGGRISVSSKPGVGTTFKLFFPIVEAPLTVDHGHSLDVRGGNETILIVEDSDDVRRFLRTALEAYGYRVVEARSGQTALELWPRFRDEIRAVVTDIVMPEMNGRQLVESLRSMAPQLRVLFVSGYTDDTALRHGIAASSAAFLQKPFSPSDLALKVRTILDSDESGHP